MYAELPFDENDMNVSKSILLNFSNLLLENIGKSEAYKNLLITSKPLHEKLLYTIDDVIKIHEESEDYEICHSLIKFKKEITKNEIN